MTTNQPFKIDDKQALEIDTMLRKIAKKKQYQYESCSSRFDFEDVVSDLWLNALDIINRTQRVDMQLIAHASFQKIVDMIRHEIRRPTTGIDPTMLEWDCPEKEGGEYLADMPGMCSKFLSPEANAEMIELARMFDDPKQRKFIELALIYFCDIEAGETKVENLDFSELEGRKDNYWNTWIAHNLGYANSCSGGYQKVRNAVQAKLVSLGYAAGFTDAVNRLKKIGYVVD